MSLAEPTDRRAVHALPASEPMPVVGSDFGGYRLLEILGEGSSSIVYLAGHDTGEPVALKVARTLVPAGGELDLLSDEATALTRLAHPNIVGIRGHGVHRRRRFIAMELCTGVSLAVLVARGPLPATDVARILLQLALALAHAHARGILHRDIKPSNVHVETDNGELRARVLDFGFARLQPDGGNEPVGTFLYMSPEHLGVVKRDLDGRSDLYALGMMAIELLAGRHPFADRDVSALIHAHAATVPQCPPHTPPGLAAIIATMCAKDPDNRYRTADGLAADLADCLRRLGRGDPSRFPLRSSDRTEEVAAPRFQGREDERAMLNEAHAAAERGLELVAIGGSSGMGKSELFRAAAENWSHSLILSARGRAYGQASAYGLFAQALEDLAARPLPATLIERMRRAVGALGGEVVRLVPQLDAVLGPTDELAELDPGQRQLRFFGVSTALLASLGSPGEPLVLFFDDVQWADEGSLELLTHLTRSDSPLRALVVLAHRTDPHEQEAGARALRAVGARPVHTIDVPPLDGLAIRALVVSMLGRAPAEVLELVESRANGSPLFAAELVRGLVDGGALFRDGDGWEVRAEVLARIGHGTSLAEVIALRLGRMEPGSRNALTLASAVGRVFWVDVVERALPAGTPVDAALIQAERAHLVRPTGIVGEWEFAHDKVREVLYDGLGPEERTTLHERIGRAWEPLLGDRGPARVVFALAYHFGRSGAADLAVRYGILAGELSLDAHAHTEALEFFDAALQRVPAGSEGHHPRGGLNEGMADAHRMLGRYDTALAHYAASVLPPVAQFDAARVAGKVGGVYLSVGEPAKAAEALVEALSALGERFPRTMSGVLWFIACGFVVQLVHTVRPVRREVSEDPVLIEIGRIYSKLTYVFYFVSTVRLLAAHLRHMNLMERHNVESEIGQAYSNHGPVCATVPLFRRGLDYAERSIALRRRLGDRFGTAQSRHFYTVTLQNAGRYADAVVQGQIAREELLRLGDRWELVTVLSQLGLSQARLGSWTAAIATIDELTEHARASNNTGGLAYAAWTRTYLASRSGTATVIADVLEVLPACERAGDTFNLIQLLHCLGRLQLRSGNVEAAIPSLERAVAMMHARLMRSDFVVVAYPALAEAYVAALERVAADAPERPALVRRAKRAVGWAVVHTHQFPNERAYTWRVQGRLAWQQGRIARARACFERSHALALEQGQPHPQALALVDLGRMMIAEQQPTFGIAALRTAVPLLRALGAREDLALVAPLLPEADVAALTAFAPSVEQSLGARAAVGAAHLEDLLVIGQQLSAIVGLEELLEQILASAVRLLGAERGILFLSEPRADGLGDELTVRAIRAVSDNEHPACTSVALRALTGGRTLVLADAQADTEFQATASVVASGVRSVLCAPMRFKEQVLGVLYVDNRLMRGMFTEANLRILESLASQAAVTLMNARAFSQLETENQVRLRSEHEAQTANRAKSTFLANMSHELRTPLNAILGYTEMVSDELVGLDRPELCDDLGRVSASARHLLRIIEDVLDLSRIEAGRLEFRVERVSLAPLLLNEVESARVLARNRGNRVMVAVDHSVSAQADPHRLRQVIANLLSNAVKFTEYGKIEVDCRTGVDGTVISVADSGIGIPEDALPHVFERFYQADNGPTRRYDGTGLGLAVCRELVEGMGGRIAVESVLGRGTTFRVTLPA